MADKTTIQWTDATWNPVTGCTKVSPGCAHCYAEDVAKRFWATQYSPVEREMPGTEGRLYRSPRMFTDVQCHEDRLDQPLRWKRPRRVFVNSMSDLFHEAVSDEFVREVFVVMALCPEHTFQVLTKRPEAMKRFLDEVDSDPDAFLFAWAREYEHDGPARRLVECWPLPNVHLGVSVEDQQRADERIPILLDTPAAVRWVSLEPLLRPIRLTQLSSSWGEWTLLSNALNGFRATTACSAIIVPHLDWVVVGGESGPRARACRVAWIRDIVRECQAASVPVFVKQLGSRPIFDEQAEHADWLCCDIKHHKGGDMAEWPVDLQVQEFPR